MSLHEERPPGVRIAPGEHHPRHALATRAGFVAEADGRLVGFTAGHLTTRFGCQGELQWLFVAPERRGSGVAGLLLARLAEWFADHGAARVCVNVEPANLRARRFYARCGAHVLSDFWMAWPDIAVARASDGSGE
jgi:GNAT superfamily N-acetyltransferase